MKKYLILVFAGPIFISLLIGSAYAASARDAVMALAKLQALCRDGISYTDYRNALGEAKFPVNSFLETSEAYKYPELFKSVNKAMEHYEYAGTLWNDKISNILGAYIAADSSLGMEIKKLYPQASPEKGTTYKSSYHVEDLLPIIWNEASKEVDNIKILYSKIR